MSEFPLIDAAELRPNPWNTNDVSSENQAKLDASLRRFGLFKPIVVREVPDEHGDTVFEIVGGEHRWEAAQRVGITEVPFFNLGAITDDKAKEIMLADNQRYGADDALALAELMKGMPTSVDDFDKFLPLSDIDIKNIFSASSIALDDIALDGFEAELDAAPEPKAVKAPKTHSLMKFKVPLKDAERITEILTKLQARHGYTGSDEMTNAGDALVHLIFQSGVEA